MFWNEFLLGLAIIVVYWILRKNLHVLVERIGLQKRIENKRIKYVNAVLQFVVTILLFICLGLIIGLGYSDVSIFLGSVIAVIGVALFAQWSILSNVTASVIVFFFFPYRVGDYIKVYDGDDSVEGEVHEISLFHVILDTNDGNLVTYPNTLVFQKTVKIYRNRATQDASSQKEPVDQQDTQSDAKTAD